MCRWFDSAPGHQEITLQNANPHRLAFLFAEQKILISDFVVNSKNLIPLLPLLFSRVLSQDFEAVVRSPNDRRALIIIIAKIEAGQMGIGRRDNCTF